MAVDVGDEDEDGLRPVRVKLAHGEALWNSAEDFWHVVGWAFNCSVAHRNRWARWRLWLEFMLEVLNEDWNEREKQCGEWEAAVAATVAADEMRDQRGGRKTGRPRRNKKTGQLPDKSNTHNERAEEIANIRRQSIIAGYLKGADSRTTRKRVINAIFANGSKEMLRDFPEVFREETKEREKKDGEAKADENGEKKTASRKLDIDEGNFGDYEMVDEEEALVDLDTEEDHPTRPKRHAARKMSPFDWSLEVREQEEKREEGDMDEELTGVDKLGGMDALVLRVRFLSLLIKVSAYLPMDFTHIPDLLALYAEYLRRIPFDVLIPFLNVSKSKLDPYPPLVAYHKALLVTQLVPLLDGAPCILEPAQAELEKHYVSMAAHSFSFADNARVSLLVEQLLLAAMIDSGLLSTEKLTAAVKAGVDARKEKARPDGRRGEKSVVDKEAKAVLKDSGSRILWLLNSLL
ncbi:hypothetical protein BDY21DRAFT_340728 [Lineolata rhizophorae]|uniref:Uncharacterized protein n=1 Tax=Lineolata rhizophorae TaxID=578093 RepID=A0A6A6P478_9PEZI|nr:hypothetical protein BDY21DRAFT_340728 [Lineolata rhizophorae]